jgi:hypothetical protein
MNFFATFNMFSISSCCLAAAFTCASWEDSVDGAYLIGDLQEHGKGLLQLLEVNVRWLCILDEVVKE